MKISYIPIVICLVATLVLFVCLPYIADAPNGVDVENAILLRTEVEKILIGSGFDCANGRNVVMMEVKKGASIVAIKDAFPSVDAVHALLVKNKQKVTASKFSVIFLSREMYEITLFEIQ